MSKKEHMPEEVDYYGEVDYYYDPAPGWGGSGEPCSRCGTTEYFNGNDDDNQPLCDKCLEKWKRMNFGGYRGGM